MSAGLTGVGIQCRHIGISNGGPCACSGPVDLVFTWSMSLKISIDSQRLASRVAEAGHGWSSPTPGASHLSFLSWFASLCQQPQA